MKSMFLSDTFQHIPCKSVKSYAVFLTRNRINILRTRKNNESNYENVF